MEPIRDALLALPGVEQVALESEIYPDEEDGPWEGYRAVPYQPSLAVRQWEWDSLRETEGEAATLAILGARPS